MKIFKGIVLILLILLGVSSGIAKIMLLPDEVRFFGGYVSDNNIIVGFGIVQLASGLMLIFRKVRQIGAGILMITFFISTVLIFRDGQFGFGLFSILPILMAGYVLNERRMRFD